MQISDTETSVLRCQSVSAQSAPARLSGSEYTELPRLVRKAGLLHRRTRYYPWKIVVTVGRWQADWRPEQRGLPYCQATLAGSCAAVLDHLNSVVRPGNVVRPATGTAP